MIVILDIFKVKVRTKVQHQVVLKNKLCGYLKLINPPNSMEANLSMTLYGVSNTSAIPNYNFVFSIDYIKCTSHHSYDSKIMFFNLLKLYLTFLFSHSQSKENTVLL